MKNIRLSLTFIHSILIVLFLFIIILPAIYWAYLNYEKTVHKSISDYFKQTNNIVETVIEQENKTLNNIALNLSNDFSNKKLESINEEDISDSISSEIEGIDLLFLRYKNKTVDFSTSLFDTGVIIGKYTDEDLLRSKIVTVKIDDIYYSALLVTKQISNSETGHILGSITVGKIFNDNFTLVSYIKEKSNTNNISFMLENKILATTLEEGSFEYKEMLQSFSLLNEYDFYTNDNRIISKQALTLFGNNTNIFVVTSINNSILKSLNNGFTEQILLLGILFIIVSILSYFIITAIVVKPSSQLLKFAQDVQHNKDATYVKGVVNEYNNIAHGLKNIIGELRDVKEQYSLAIEGTQDGLWDWNIKSNKVYFSDTFKVMLGYEKEDDLNSNNFWEESIFKEDFKAAKENIIKHFTGLNDYYENTYRFKCKNGSYKWMISRGKALFDENKRAYRMVGFHTDVHHMKELERENKQKEKLLYQQSKMASMGEMIGNIAHQWRQPLSTISTASTGIKIHKELDILTDEQLLTTMEIINNTAQHLSQTIDDFRDFFNPNNVTNDFTIQEVVNKTINILISQFNSKDIELIQDIQDTQIKGLENELIQVLINIINNSRDALLEKHNTKRLIFINSFKSNEEVVILIKDNAGGIEENIINRIFEPYFTTKDKKVGTGIGLYMCEEIIHRHMNGDIKVENADFNYENINYKGALFTIKLPLFS